MFKGKMQKITVLYLHYVAANVTSCKKEEKHRQ